jgi:MYXO-CTERM domain-containing protein
MRAMACSLLSAWCRRLGVAATASVVAWAWPAGESRACSCGAYNDLAAPVSDTYPSNGGILLRSNCGEVTTDIYAVSVDGIEADLVHDAEAWTSGLGLAHIEPEPQPGQQVVVSRCTDGLDSTICPAEPTWVEVIEYTATDPDEIVPAASGVVSLQHGDNRLVLCTGGDLEFRAVLTDVVHEQAPLLFRGRLRTPSGEVIGTRMHFVDEPTTELSLGFFAQGSDLGVAPEEMCVEVVAIDLSGNLAEVDEICGSVGEPGSDTGAGSTGSPDSAGDESSTGEAPHGTTGPAGHTTGVSGADTSGPDQDHAISDRGCACTAARGSTPAPAWATACVAGLLFLRRRRSARAG